MPQTSCLLNVGCSNTDILQTLVGQADCYQSAGRQGGKRRMGEARGNQEEARERRTHQT